MWFIDPGRADFARMLASKFARLAEQGQIDTMLIPTPTEEDFFHQLNVPCWPPEERTEERLREYLHSKRK